MLEELKKLLAEQPELFGKGLTEADLEKMGEKQLKKLEETLREKLGIGADADMGKAISEVMEKARKFEESEKQAEVDKAIAEAVKDLPFGKDLNEQFTESIKGAELPSAEAVKKFAEAKRDEYGKIAAKLKLGKMGFNQGTGVQAMGDVLENETGTPEFARGAFLLAESVRKHENREIGRAHV